MGRHSVGRTTPPVAPPVVTPAAAPVAPQRRRPMPFPREPEPAASAAVSAAVSTPPPTPTKKTSGRGLGRLSLLLVLLSIGFVAAAGITFVISPNWGGFGAIADNGHIPNSGGKRVPYISPHMIVIPKLHARAPIVRVGTQNRELVIPLDPKVVGWWDGGAKPGARRGTAILAGHINYAGVSGVLGAIGTLKPRDTIYVTGMHGKRHVKLRFSVTGVRTYRKTALPYQRIFDQHSAGRLAIVTCGGPFDSSTGNYEDNVVVFAVPS